MFPFCVFHHETRTCLGRATTNYNQPRRLSYPSETILCHPLYIHTATLRTLLFLLSASFSTAEPLSGTFLCHCSRRLAEARWLSYRNKARHLFCLVPVGCLPPARPYKQLGPIPSRRNGPSRQILLCQLSCYLDPTRGCIYRLVSCPCPSTSTAVCR